jgi:hypothetical protein
MNISTRYSASAGDLAESFFAKRLQGCKIQTKVMFEANAAIFSSPRCRYCRGNRLVPKELDGTHISAPTCVAPHKR